MSALYIATTIGKFILGTGICSTPLLISVILPRVLKTKWWIAGLIAWGVSTLLGYGAMSNAHLFDITPARNTSILGMETGLFSANMLWISMLVSYVARKVKSLLKVILTVAVLGAVAYLLFYGSSLLTQFTLG